MTTKIIVLRNYRPLLFRFTITGYLRKCKNFVFETSKFSIAPKYTYNILWCIILYRWCKKRKSNSSSWFVKLNKLSAVSETAKEKCSKLTHNFFKENSENITDEGDQDRRHTKFNVCFYNFQNYSFRSDCSFSEITKLAGDIFKYFAFKWT